MAMQNFPTQETLKTMTLTLKDLVLGADFAAFHDTERINLVCDDEKWLSDSNCEENISKLASHCTSLSSLELTGIDQAGIEKFVPLLKISTSLECDSVHVDTFRALNDSSIFELTLNDPWLVLYDEMEIQPAGLTRLKSLKVLDKDLRSCMCAPGILDDKIVKNLINIDKLYLECEVSLDAIGKYCSKLTNLHMAVFADYYNCGDGDGDGGRDSPHYFEELLQQDWTALGQGCLCLETIEIESSACGCLETMPVRLDGLDFSYFRNLKFLSIDGTIGNEKQNGDMNWNTLFQLGTYCRFLEELDLREIFLDYGALMEEVRSTKGENYVLFPMLKSVSMIFLDHGALMEEVRSNKRDNCVLFPMLSSVGRIILGQGALMEEAGPSKGNNYVLFPMLKSVRWIASARKASCNASFLKKHMPLMGNICKCAYGVTCHNPQLWV